VNEGCRGKWGRSKTGGIINEDDKEHERGKGAIGKERRQRVTEEGLAPMGRGVRERPNPKEKRLNHGTDAPGPYASLQTHCGF